MTDGPAGRSVNVFVPTLARQDAVSDQARHQTRLLREWGHDARLVADAWDAASAGEAAPLRQALAAPAGAGWVVHYSIWSEGLREILGHAAGPRILVYHNVTPPELLPSGPVAERCLQARRALPGLTDGWDLVLADSTYNAAELGRAGFRRVEVVPLLLPLPPTAPATERGDSVLFVGRISPSKGIDDLLKAFALLRRLHRPSATLDIVGSPAGWEGYAAGLEVLAQRVGPEGIAFRGSVEDRERDGLYSRAGAVCLMSRHEGFCAPIIEALRAGAPVVARDVGAVAETLGEGGLLLPSGDPRLAAEALALVMDDGRLRERLSAGAREAIARVDPSVVEERLRTTLGEAVARGQSTA